MEEIFKRRSYHDGFDSEQKISDDDMSAILKAGMNAPSANNKQPWEFVVINDKEKLSTLAKVNNWTGACAKSSHVIVICARPDSYGGLDVGIAVENIALQATHLGIGSLIMGIHDNDFVQNSIKQLLNIPDDFTAYIMIALGYPTEVLPPNDRWLPDKIHLNQF